jgi:hypothetical protein
MSNERPLIQVDEKILAAAGQSFYLKPPKPLRKPLRYRPAQAMIPDKEITNGSPFKIGPDSP